MKRSLNLIPPAAQRRFLLRRVARLAVKASLASGACVAVLLGVEWARGLSTRHRLDELDARYTPLAKLQQESEEISSRISQLEKREQLSLRLNRDTQGLAVLGAVAHAASELGGAVYIERLAYEGPTVASRHEKAAQELLRLEGAGQNGMAVAQFAARLRETGVFQSVSVESTAPAVAVAAGAKRFSIHCQI